MGEARNLLGLPSQQNEMTRVGGVARWLRHWRWPLATAAASALVLSGCAQNAGPGSTPTTGPSSTTSAQPKQPLSGEALKAAGICTANRIYPYYGKVDSAEAFQPDPAVVADLLNIPDPNLEHPIVIIARGDFEPSFGIEGQDPPKAAWVLVSPESLQSVEAGTSDCIDQQSGDWLESFDESALGAG